MKFSISCWFGATTTRRKVSLSNSTGEELLLSCMDIGRSSNFKHKSWLVVAEMTVAQQTTTRRQFWEEFANLYVLKNVLFVFESSSQIPIIWNITSMIGHKLTNHANTSSYTFHRIEALRQVALSIHEHRTFPLHSMNTATTRAEMPSTSWAPNQSKTQSYAIQWKPVCTAQVVH